MTDHDANLLTEAVVFLFCSFSSVFVRNRTFCAALFRKCVCETRLRQKRYTKDSCFSRTKTWHAHTTKFLIGSRKELILATDMSHILSHLIPKQPVFLCYPGELHFLSDHTVELEQRTEILFGREL